MPSLTAATLARELRSLDDAELAAFVADLWAARGFETSVEGTTVVAVRGVESRTIRCGARPTEGPVDVLVRASRSPDGPGDEDVRVIGAESLRQMLLYAVDRRTADRLCRKHFGRSLSARPADGPLHTRIAGAPAGQLLAVGLVIVIVSVVAIGATGVGSYQADDRSAPAVEPSPSVAAASLSPTDRTDSGLPAAGGQLFRYPTGLGSSGVTDAEALAAAHRTALANSSWSLRLTHEGSHDLMHPYRDWTGSNQVVVRADPTSYAYQVTGFGRIDNETFPIEIYVDYADGSTNYRRHIGVVGDGFQRTRLPASRPPGVFAALSAAYVERYLTTTASRVETVSNGATTRQRVVATGTPTELARTVENYRAVAIIDRQGLVHRLVVEYTLLRRIPDPVANGIATPYAPSDQVPTEPVGTVRFEMVLADHGTVNLTPPGWYDRARNVTAGDEPAPWPNEPAV